MALLQSPKLNEGAPPETNKPLSDLKNRFHKDDWNPPLALKLIEITGGGKISYSRGEPPLC